MEFLKKNYMKMIIAVIMTAIAIVFVVLIAKYDALYHDLKGDFKSAADPKNGLSNLFSYIAALVFFVLSAAVVIMTMFDKTKSISKWALCSVGVIGIALMATSIGCALSSESSKYAKEIMSGTYDTTITTVVETRSKPLVEAGIREQIPALAEVPFANWESVDLGPTMGNITALQLFNAKLAEAVTENAPVQIEKAKSTASYQYFSNVAKLISQLVIFGLLPLCFGIKQALKKEQK